MTKKRRVVVTGLGVVACNGIGKDDFWQANMQGRSGVVKVSGFNTDNFDTKIAGEVRGFDPCRYMPSEVVKKVDRFVHFGLACTKMAVEDSRLDLETEDKNRIGVVIGSGLGGMMFHEEQLVAHFEKSNPRCHPTAVPRISPNAVSSHIAIQHGCLGPNMVISTACASANHAIGEAFRKIQWGDMDLCVTGGVEATLSPLNFEAYYYLRVMSKNSVPEEASRPFDLKRDGFVLSEGGGLVIMEELEHARRRNAPIYAEVAGYASNSGGRHMVMPDLSGADAARVMADALKDAGRDAGQVDYINAHATSTVANDRAETMAIKNVFGPKAYKVPISSTKSMIGHSLGAAGGIEAVVCALAIKNRFIPPTINYKDRDPQCDLDYVPNEGRCAHLKTVLSNSFGFGNCNACVVFSDYNGD
ncbi:MAG: beta-ketoacyl-ACP synthase II [Candidatus Omnitrophica bacterium]|nr:beta-ketoacyl-ACP synthase II [Candidatus Omnitrophota bacterium]MDE2008798.1 beta-ketoacyl-ACP synthase II [Candidatus Omnitrophota bacterium]MDE2213639.1 beta-ketoacyl-ACP synthase II [Candidatus Omnitrophota bacterium]MDE2230460.1 beta-ketoacyl-ACP synthase II [Candidatus Omnitrophota bacterium]